MSISWKHSIIVFVAATLIVASPTPETRSTVPTPGNGLKAGSAGGRVIPFMKDHLGWWYDWTPRPSGHDEVYGVSMLWGSGNNGDEDWKRFNEFSHMTDVPKYLLGFNEPDCDGRDTSAKMNVDQGVRLWNQYIAPKGQQGALLGSPSMCMQKDEWWLKQFSQKNLNRPWDFTAIHVYKADMDGVRQDIDHYWNTYGKPILITEMACVHDNGQFTACWDQNQINQWIYDVVDLLEADDRIMGYAYTDGGGLGLTSPMDGDNLSASGKAYLGAISRYSKPQCSANKDCPAGSTCTNGRCTTGGGSNPPPPASCSWEGHCEGASCGSDNDCSDNLTCSNNRCAKAGSSAPPPPPVSCSWEGHCEGAYCANENDCSDNLECRANKCTRP